MSGSRVKNVTISASWSMEPVPLGVLSSTLTDEGETFSFSAQKQWLQSRWGRSFDPLGYSQQGPVTAHSPYTRIIGLLMDSSPDGWGRDMLSRYEQLCAVKERRTAHRLSELEYLMGVHDHSRMGALRLAAPEVPDSGGTEAAFSSAPPAGSLKHLANSTLLYEDDRKSEDPDHEAWVEQMAASGAPLGGARPKSYFTEADGSLWIAKFPSSHDPYDVGAWEMVVNELARRAGIPGPECRIMRLASEHRTFLSRRFDRSEEGHPIHFTSARSLVGYHPGSSIHAGVSYLDLADLIVRYGAEPERDLRDLWKRMVFNICISNIDDHLRNHGFLLTEHGWRLSPAYDLNPIPFGGGLCLNITRDDNQLVLKLARKVAPNFHLSSAAVEMEIERIRDAVSQWRPAAVQFDIPADEQQLMAPAFSALETGSTLRR